MGADKKKRISPTARTLKFYQDRGYMVGVVEKFNAYTKRYKDLFGFIDLLAVGEGRTIGIQATSTSNMASRLAKIRDERFAEAQRWLLAGNEIVVIGWKKYKRPEARRYWRETVRVVTAVDLEAREVVA